MISKDMLLKAAGLVGGDRAKDYGDITSLHHRIAGLWNYWLDHQGGMVELRAYDVAIMMLLLKVARLIHSPGHSDSHIDIAGYAAVAEEIAQKTINKEKEDE